MSSHSEFVDRIYEAALLPEHWPTILDELASVAGGLGTILFAASGKQTQWISSTSTQHIMTRFVSEGWIAKNTRAARLLNHSTPEFITDLDVFTREELDRDDVYTKALRPMGVGWGAATAIAVPSGDLLVFSIEREFAKGPVERERLPRLNHARPHLARAALLASRLVFERAKAFVGSLEVVGLPAAVAGGHGRLIALNNPFAELQPQIRIGAGDNLILTDSDAQAMFADIMKHIERPGTGGGSIPLKASGGKSLAVLHVLPLRREARDIFNSARALLLVNSIDRRAVPSAEVLQGLFDLTPGEVRVARQIADGNGIDAAADALGLHRETVRTHIKSLLAKTGRRNQAGLVSVLGSVAKF